MKKTAKVILGSAMTMAMCASLIAGSTLALFSTKTGVNIAITSGKVDVTATIDKTIKTYSYTEQDDGSFASTEMTPGKFYGGEAVLNDDGRTLNLNGIIPGDKAEININLENHSTMTIKYQIVVTTPTDSDLYQALDVKIGEEPFVSSQLSATKLSKWNTVTTEEKISAIPVTIELPYGTEGVEDKECELQVAVQAVQGNVFTSDPVAIDPDDPATQNLVPIYSADELVSFRNAVNGGDNYSGKTVKLFEDIDLENKSQSPIGTPTHAFNGTFDGQGHTIRNLTVDQAGDEDDRYVGMFGKVNHATIQNVKFGGTVQIEVDFSSYVAVVVGHGSATIKDIVIDVSADSYIDTGANGMKCGSIIGYSEGSVIENVTSNINMVKGMSGFGGIIGWSKGDTVKNATYNGDIKVMTTQGGILGTQGGGTTTLEDCHYNGTLQNGYSDTHDSPDTFYGLIGSINGGSVSVKSSSLERTVSDGLTLYVEWNESGRATTMTYRIYNADGMVDWASRLSASTTLTGYADLMQNVDLEGVKWVAPSGAVWFNGNNHTISNVTCVPGEGEASYWRAGLFGSVSTGYVKDVTIRNVTARGAQAGVVLGHTHGFTLTNITISGDINITYEKYTDSSYTEEYGGIGIFIGAIGDSIEHSTGLKVAADCVATLDTNGIESGFVPERDNLVLGYRAPEPEYDYRIPAEDEVVVEEGAQIVVRNGAELYTLYAPDQLVEFAASVQDGHDYAGKTVKLFGDVDLEGVVWQPIGSNDHPFKGNFDGGNHTIDHMTLDKKGVSYAGFFGKVDGSVQDLKFTNADVTFSTYGGVLAGYSTGSISGVTVESSTVNQTDSSGNHWAGILTGYADRLISDCKLTGSTVNANGFVGGVTGQGYVSFEDVTVDACEINGGWKTGGVIGQWNEDEYHMTNVLVQNSTIRGTDYVSAMAGVCHYGNKTFTSCQVQGSAIEAAKDGNGTLGNAGGFIGGLIEGTSDYTVTFDRCNINGGDQNLLNIRATRIESAGGFIGGMYSSQSGSTATLNITITDTTKEEPYDSNENRCNVKFEAESFGENIGIYMGDFSRGYNTLLVWIRTFSFCSATFSDGTKLSADKIVGGQNDKVVVSASVLVL